MLITRRADFSASHVCRNPLLSDEENQAIYGPESRPHGHNYVLEVTVEGDPDPQTGMVVDLKVLKDVIQRDVVGPMDHRFLNCDVPPFQTVIPTAENIAVEIWRRLAPHLNGETTRLHAVRLYETEDLFVEYFGEQP